MLYCLPYARHQTDRAPLSSTSRYVALMHFASRAISDFVDKNPTIRILALSFLIMVGMKLIIESFDVHMPKRYIYLVMCG